MKDSLEKFLFFLNNYEEEAFRLEILPTYDVSHESEDFKDFLEHKKISINKDLKEYIDIHSSKILQGKRHIRARVIPSPLTDYFRYETNVGYLPQSHKGFELYFMEQDSFDSKFTKSYGVLKDFWLFDKSNLVEMNYDSSGKFLGVEIIENSEQINKARKVRNEFVQQANPFGYLMDNYPDIILEHK